MKWRSQYMRFRKINAFILAVVMSFSVLLTACEDKDTASSQRLTESITTSSTVNRDESIADGATITVNANTSDSTSKVKFEFKSGNNWAEDGKTNYEYQGNITNSQNVALTGWVVTIPISEDVTVKQCWGATYEISDGKIIIKPESHNSEIPASGSINFGLQIQASSEINTGGVVFTATTKKTADNSANNNNNNNANTGGEAIPNVGAKEVPPPNTDDWLSVKGNKIVDSNGKEVWLTGVNWFGYNTGTNTFDGLWAADLNSSLSSIADHGFNLLRLPISIELVNNWEDGVYPDANFNNTTNSYLVGMNSLEIFDYVVGQCHANGMKIMIDYHCAVTDSMGHMKPLWTDGDITEEDYLRALSWMADRYKSDDTIIAYDLKNEPHGKQNETPRAKWDNSKDADNWKYIAEKAAAAVLAKNPNALIMVEGIEIYPTDIKANGNFKSTNEDDYYFNWWGGNLRGVKDNPVDLGKHQNKLVYSPHDYGPTVYEQPWFKGGYTFDSLYEDCWKDNWMFIHEDNIAPLLIGEWGGFMKDPNLEWMTYFRQLISENKLHHTFWCFNANSVDTGGLVLGDFITWDSEKYEFVKEVLWQKDGKFVGLDHEIPLGENGITLSDY
ncbi:MAG TPA: cellulase family glycosylhydrolase [Clostridiales bacterium]|nr:cellulase family glycosylhydrolase [Clostridiales bacterium]